MRESYSGLIFPVVNEVSSLHREPAPAHCVNDITQYIKPDALYIVPGDPLKLNTTQANLIGQGRNGGYIVTLYRQISQITLELDYHLRHTSLYIIKRYFGQILVTPVSLRDCIIKKYNRQYMKLIVWKY